MIVDQFSLYQTKVKEYLEEHTQVMQKYAPGYVGYRKKINDLARPFIDGYFTLAVVGKMSAGKSTFINALIEDKNILPTDHFQTTCTLTKIRHGENKQVSVTYADGTTKTIENDIEVGLKQLVAIPEEYRDLPINQINNLIVDGLTADEIVNKLEFLEEKAAKNINVKELKEYIKLHNKSNIATEVIIKLPLPSSYRGWQIIDTPGVDAIGGIEETTSEFLEGTNEYGANNVDAVVFVHSGKGQIEDGSFNKFVKKTCDSLTEEAKRRMFIVITHASDSDFRRHKDANIANAKKLFVDYKYGFDENRLVCVDSLLALLHTYILKERVNAKLIIESDTPSGWENNEWEACKDLVGGIETELKRKKKEINNENILNLMEEIAGFSSFRVKVDEFVRVEKEKAFLRFVKKMVDDLKECILNKEADLILCKNKRDMSDENFRQKIENEKTKIKQVKGDLNTSLNNIRRNFPSKVREKINSISEDISKLEDVSNKDFLRTKSETINKTINKCQEGLLRELSSIIEKQIKKTKDYNKVSFELPDCESIFDSTKSDYTEIIQHKHKEKAKGFVNWWKRLFSSDKGYDITYTYEEKYDADEHLRGVIGKIQSVFEDSLENLRKSIFLIIQAAGDLIRKELGEKLKNQEEKLSGYESERYGTKELCSIEIKCVENTIIKLKSVLTKTLGDTNYDN